MIIEDLKKEDIQGCLDIYNYYIKNSNFTLEERALTLCEYTDRAEGVLKKYPFIVGKNDEGVVVGFAYLDAFNPRSGYRFTADLSIYIDHNLRHSGLGKLLWDNISKRAKDMGITNIISIITSENEASCRFHEKQNFVLEGCLKDIAEKFDKKLSVSYYRKAL